MKVFLKSKELSLENGGYLTSKEGTPVSNVAFQEAQKHAEYVITLAEKVKGKDFVGKKADSLDSIKKEVVEMLSNNNAVEYVKAPKKKKQPVTESLKAEALSFIKDLDKGETTKKVNEFLNNFNVINEFETFGLFFEQDISKLNKIYTMKEVIVAVQSVIELLD